MTDLLPIPILLAAAFLAFISCRTTDQTLVSPRYEILSPFAVSYEKITPAEARNYDLIIVEPNHYNKSEITALKSTGTNVLAYVSLGEVNPGRWYFPILAERGFLGKNENWDSYYINLADSVTYKFFFTDVFSELTFKGFDGFFLDTIDAVAPYTSRSHLQPHMERMITELDARYPEHFIVQNAGLFLLDKTADVVDAVLIEDVATHYDFKTDSYSLKEEEKYRQKVSIIKKISNTKALPFLIVDFATSISVRQQAVQRLDTLAFPYFINTIKLNNISEGVSGNNY